MYPTLIPDVSFLGATSCDDLQEYNATDKKRKPKLPFKMNLFIVIL